jgi:cytochrome oxidase Cu insertion factor (SCO1/SenC/PrrC family)
LVFLVFFAAPLACSTENIIRGTELTSSNNAPGFHLHDQFGRPARLADYAGKVVALTFLYTRCTDVCPIITSQLRQVHDMLGAQVDEVAFVAISVDPERDTVETTHAYSQNWGMLNRWVFLTGGREDLEPVWKSYFVDPFVSQQREEEHPVPTPVVGAGPGGVEAFHLDAAAGYLVDHSAPVYLIDGEGRMRIVFTPPLKPDSIVNDIRVLLR